MAWGSSRHSSVQWRHRVPRAAVALLAAAVAVGCAAEGNVAAQPDTREKPDAAAPTRVEPARASEELARLAREEPRTGVNVVVHFSRHMTLPDLASFVERHRPAWLTAHLHPPGQAGFAGTGFQVTLSARGGVPMETQLARQRCGLHAMAALAAQKGPPRDPPPEGWTDTWRTTQVELTMSAADAQALRDDAIASVTLVSRHAAGYLEDLERRLPELLTAPIRLPPNLREAPPECEGFTRFGAPIMEGPR